MLGHLLLLEDPRTLHPNYDQTCIHLAIYQPAIVIERLPNARLGSRPYEITIIHTRCWLVDVWYGCDRARHSTCGGNRLQAHAQTQPSTLECSEAYLQISTTSILDRMNPQS